MVVEKIRTSIVNYKNEIIESAQEQQSLLHERIKTTSEVSNFHFNNFLLERTPEKELKALKAFEMYAYDRFNFNTEVVKELQEKLRIANELLKENNIEIIEK